jgi:hypothetical protein
MQMVLTYLLEKQILFLAVAWQFHRGKIKVENPDSKTQKIKIQIGDALFEAEGPTSIIEQQFQAFVGLLSKRPEESKLPENLDIGSGNGKPQSLQPISDAMLEMVFRDEGDYISLSARPPNPGDSLLVLLYGFERIKKEPKVTGVMMMKAAKKSGVTIPRVDRYMNENAELVLTGGAKRGKRYSLNNRGTEHAEKIIRGLVE